MKSKTNLNISKNSLYTSAFLCLNNLVPTNLKGGVYNIYERILSERNRLDKQINYLQHHLNSFPKGKLICARNENRYKWYISDGHTSTYLPKKERHLAEQLALKKYLSLLLKNYQQEKLALDFYLRHHKSAEKHTEHMLSELSGYHELLSPYFKPESKELLDWMNFPYEHNTSHPEHLTYRTFSGHYVRSKSELLIDMALYTNILNSKKVCMHYRRYPFPIIHADLFTAMIPMLFKQYWFYTTPSIFPAQ